MRWARPSTMAVLPTPGSPMRTGLFLVRRDRTWMTRRTSSSRPITGSSLPLRGELGQVAPVLLERLVLVLRIRIGHALAAADAGERLEDTFAGDAEPFQRLAAADRAARLRRQAKQQVLGADVVVLHLLGVGGGGVDDHAQARREVGFGAAARHLAAACPGCRADREPERRGRPTACAARLARRRRAARAGSRAGARARPMHGRIPGPARALPGWPAGPFR